jgi:hypothetical protein
MFGCLRLSSEHLPMIRAAQTLLLCQAPSGKFKTSALSPAVQAVPDSATSSTKPRALSIMELRRGSPAHLACRSAD